MGGMLGQELDLAKENVIEVILYINKGVLSFNVNRVGYDEVFRGEELRRGPFYFAVAAWGRIGEIEIVN